jgi:hypothetical protein
MEHMPERIVTPTETLYGVLDGIAGDTLTYRLLPIENEQQYADAVAAVMREWDAEYEAAEPAIRAHANRPIGG